MGCILRQLSGEKMPENNLGVQLWIKYISSNEEHGSSEQCQSKGDNANLMEFSVSGSQNCMYKVLLT